MWSDTEAAILSKRWARTLLEVTGDPLFHLPEAPSPTEATEMYLWSWDVKKKRKGAQEGEYTFPPNRIRVKEGSFRETCIS